MRCFNCGRSQRSSSRGRGESETLGTHQSRPAPHLPQSPCVPLSSPLLSPPHSSRSPPSRSRSSSPLRPSPASSTKPSPPRLPATSSRRPPRSGLGARRPGPGDQRRSVKGARRGLAGGSDRSRCGASTAPRARRRSMARPRWPEALGEGRATGSCQPTSRATSPAPPSPPLQSTSPARPSSPAEARSPPVRYLSCNLVVLGIAFFSTRPRCVGCLPPYPRFLIFFIWPLFLPWFCSDEEQGNFCLQWRGALT